MRPCTKHPHSSPETALRCAKEYARRRADRKLKPIYFQQLYEGRMFRVRMVKHNPPKQTLKRGFLMLVWSEDSNMPY